MTTSEYMQSEKKKYFRSLINNISKPGLLRSFFLCCCAIVIENLNRLCNFCYNPQYHPLLTQLGVVQAFLAMGECAYPGLLNLSTCCCFLLDHLD